ncbi:MAG: 5'-methylthioadenosine/S-adenosylhomocysteine nucleosidase [Oscillospiraceae bacterium]|nr:5'-methylthioadenosine/S-adenosylhomocysteine nucleosidase [Oscillospiraceae bacterium]
MIGIGIATELEWQATLDYFEKNSSDCEKYPFGEYFKISISGKEVLIYYSGNRKVSCSAAAQYIIDKFSPEKIIAAGTCAGISDKCKILDIVIPSKAVQYDCTVKEVQPLIKKSFSVDIDLSEYDIEDNFSVIGTADKPVVMPKDFAELKENNITIADCEAAGVAYVCKMNGIKCVIIKGVSDIPSGDNSAAKDETHDKQFNVFVQNTPKVMRKIFSDYITKFL